MTTDEAIRDLTKLRSFHNGSYGEACRMAIAALKKQSENSDSVNIQIKKRPSFEPCKCGKNRRTHHITNAGLYYECMNCGFVSPAGKNEREARENWNGAVKEEHE